MKWLIRRLSLILGLTFVTISIGSLVVALLNIGVPVLTCLGVTIGCWLLSYPFLSVELFRFGKWKNIHNQKKEAYKEKLNEKLEEYIASEELSASSEHSRKSLIKTITEKKAIKKAIKKEAKKEVNESFKEAESYPCGFLSIIKEMQRITDQQIAEEEMLRDLEETLRPFYTAEELEGEMQYWIRKMKKEKEQQNDQEL